MAVTDPMEHIATAFQEVANLVRQGGGPEDLMNIVLTGDLSMLSAPQDIDQQMLMPEGADDVYGDILNMSGDPFTAAEAATQKSVIDMMDDQQAQMLAMSSGSEARTLLAASSFEKTMQDSLGSGVTIDDQELLDVLAGNFGISESDLDQELKEHERRFADWESQAVAPTIVDPNISNVPLIFDEFGPSAQETAGALPPSVDPFTSALNGPAISDEDYESMFLPDELRSAFGYPIAQTVEDQDSGLPLYEIGGDLPRELVDYLTEDDEKVVETEVVTDRKAVSAGTGGENTINEEIFKHLSFIYESISKGDLSVDKAGEALATLIGSPMWTQSSYHARIFPAGVTPDKIQREALKIAQEWGFSLDKDKGDEERRYLGNFDRWEFIIDSYGGADYRMKPTTDTGTGTGVGLAERATELEYSTDEESAYIIAYRGWLDAKNKGKQGYEYIGSFPGPTDPDTPKVELFVYRGIDGKSQELYGITWQLIGTEVTPRISYYGTLEGQVTKGPSQLTLGGYTWILDETKEIHSANRWATGGQQAITATGGMALGGTGMPVGVGWGDMSPTQQWDALRAEEMGEDIHNPIKWGARRFGYGEARGKYLLAGGGAGQPFADWLGASGYRETPVEDIAQQWESLAGVSAGLGQPRGEGSLTNLGFAQESLIGGDDRATTKRRTIHMIMAALGAGEGMGSRAMARTLSDMYDVYATQQLAQMGQPGGFAGEFSKWLAPGAIPGSEVSV
jgi:hypothetical protein